MGCVGGDVDCGVCGVWGCVGGCGLWSVWGVGMCGGDVASFPESNNEVFTSLESPHRSH